MTDRVRQIALVIALAAAAVAPACAADLWLIGGVPVLNQAAQWQGIRADAADMWTPDAPWKAVAGHTRVMLFSPGILLRARDDDLLKQAFSDMKRRNIEFAVELGLLTRTDTCQAKFEGYLDDIDTVRRIVNRISRTGGDLRYIAMDEPFYYGHQYSGPGACHESAAELARRIAGSIAVVRKVFPNVQIGDEEVVDSSRAATDELAGWADAFKEATGEPLAFLHTDVSWSQAAMLNLVPLSAALRTRHVPLGVMYNAEGDATQSDEVWTQNAKEHFAEIEGVLGVHPDHAVFQTWVARPSRMMPEDQPGTLTNLALTYLHPSPILSISRQENFLVGRLTDDQGQPIAGASLIVDAVDVGGRMAPTEKHIAGTVPKDAASAMIGIRSNIEASCVCLGDATVKVGVIKYRESGTGQQQADIAPGAPNEPVHAIALSQSRKIATNLKKIPVTPGASYTLSAPIAAPSNAESAGYVTAIFFDAAGKGLGRNFLWFKPSRQTLTTVSTGADGKFKIPLSPAVAEAHAEIRVAYSGSKTLRPALALINP